MSQLISLVVSILSLWIQIVHVHHMLDGLTGNQLISLCIIDSLFIMGKKYIYLVTI